MSRVSVTPLRRSFSTQASRLRPPSSTPAPPPPRRPPHPPGLRTRQAAEPGLRRPPGPPSPSYPRQSYPPSGRNQAFEEEEEDDDDDIFASNILTSHQVEKQRQIQQAQELKVSKAHDAWVRRLHMVQDEARRCSLDRYPPPSAKSEVSDALHETFNTYLGQLNARSKAIQTALNRFPALEAKARKIAHSQGQRDHVKHAIKQLHDRMREVIDRVCERRVRAQIELRETEEELQRWEDTIYARVFALHWASSFQKLAACEKQLDKVDQTCRELKYSIDWRAWRTKQLDLQHDHALSALTETKAVGAEQHESTGLFDQVATSSERLVSLIRQLLPTSPTEPMSEDLVELRHRVTHLLPCFHDVTINVLSADAHNWRHVNRLLQTHIRLPQAVNHHLFEEEMKSYLAPCVRAAHAIWALARDLEILTKSRSADRRYRKQCADIESKSEYMLVTIFDFVGDLGNILQDGLHLQNPALQNAHGGNKYAVLLPFVHYRRVMTGLKASVSYTLRALSESTQLPALQDFAISLGQHAASLANDTRDFYQSYNELGLGIATHCLQNPDVAYSAVWMRQLNAQLAQQHETAQALAGLSNHTGIFDFHRTKKIASIIDPRTLLGDSKLYSRNPVPVEYVISPLHAQRAAEQLQQCSIIGMQMVHCFDGPPHYITFASARRVYVFECEARRQRAGMSVSLHRILRPLLEDSNIVKVTHGFGVRRRFLIASGIVPGGIVDIAGSVRSQGRGLRHADRRVAPRHSGEEDLFLVDSLTRHWKSVAQKSMLEVLCRLALFPAYNLITFLNAMSPDILEQLPLKLQRDVLEAREELSTKARSEADGQLTLGPLLWGEQGTAQSRMWPLSFVESLERASSPDSDVLGLVRAITRREITNLSLQREHNRVLTTEALKSEDTQNYLAAYRLFTSFGEDLGNIRWLLSIENPARAILWVKKNLHFKLFPTDVARLKEVEPFGGVSVPAGMRKPSLTKELMNQPKKWLADVGSRISSMIVEQKPKTGVAKNEVQDTPSIAQSAELDDDEIRPAFKIKAMVNNTTPPVSTLSSRANGWIAEPESARLRRPKGEGKRPVLPKGSHKMRLLSAKEKTSMQSQRMLAPGQRIGANRINTVPLKTSSTKRHYTDFRDSKEKSPMGDAQAALR